MQVIYFLFKCNVYDFVNYMMNERRLKYSAIHLKKKSLGIFVINGNLILIFVSYINTFEDLSNKVESASHLSMKSSYERN